MGFNERERDKKQELLFPSTLETTPVIPISDGKTKLSLQQSNFSQDPHSPEKNTRKFQLKLQKKQYQLKQFS